MTRHARVRASDAAVVRRPRVQLGRLLRGHLSCPACRGRRTRIVAFRETACRLECAACGLRFTISPSAVATALRTHPGAVVDSLTDREKTRIALYHDPFAHLAELIPDRLRDLVIAAIRAHGQRIQDELDRIEVTASAHEPADADRVSDAHIEATR